jgi:GNAT superfamily N-acetyltransferase
MTGSSVTFAVRPMTAADAEAVLRIYQTGLDAGQASFETVVPDWEVFDRVRLPEHRHVAVLDGCVVGWAAVSRVSARPVYAGVVEHSVYVDPSVHGRGVGTALLAALIASNRAGPHLDYPVRGLPRQRREPAPAPAGRLPHRRNPRTDRLSPRPLARRAADRTAQHHRRHRAQTQSRSRQRHRRDRLGRHQCSGFLASV